MDDAASKPASQATPESSVFDRVAQQFDQVGPPLFTHFGERIAALANLQPGERVLDVGTGRGAALFPAAEAVGRHGAAMGVDAAGQMVKELQSELDARGRPPQIQVQQMDAQALAFDDASFDVVLCSLTLFLIDDPLLALRQMLRVLRPGGRLIVSTVSQSSEHFAWFMELVAPDPESPRAEEEASGDTPEGLRRLLTLAGGADATTTLERCHFTYRDFDALWASLWSHGARYFLDPLAPAERELVRRQARIATARFQIPEGICPPSLEVLFGAVVKP